MDIYKLFFIETKLANLFRGQFVESRPARLGSRWAVPYVCPPSPFSTALHYAPREEEEERGISQTRVTEGGDAWP